MTADRPSFDPDEPPLAFGTAGLRGPVREGPGGMNTTTVTRATWAVGRWLTDRCLGGSTVVVGRDARHGSEEFFAATCEVLAAQGFAVVGLPAPAPTPEVAWAVRELGAVAGIQITASHNPPADNGYKVYVTGGAQLISPADREIEALIRSAPADVPRTPVTADPRAAGVETGYLARVASLVPAGPRDLRIALTPLHGVGGAAAVAALRAAGFTDVHVVAVQFAPDPDFPTVTFPNPEEPGAADLLLALAAEVDADLAIALDPDADRCALGVRDPARPPAHDGAAGGAGGAGGWRMLTGDETGALLGDRVLATTSTADPLVATTIVSSELLGAIAAAHGAASARTLTGFKNLVRAVTPGAGGPGHLVFAYEEAIGLCVDPDAVRDKDGISAAVVAAAYAAKLKARGRTPLDALADLYAAHGVHLTAQHSVRVDALTDIAAILARLRSAPPAVAAGVPVTCEDLLLARPRTDALVFRGDGVRVVVRPSGTEPKCKFYVEAVAHGAVPAATAVARARLDALLADVRIWAAG